MENMRPTYLRSNDRGFKFIEIRHGIHDRKRLVIWINNRIPIEQTDGGDNRLHFPVQDAVITATEKGSLVMKPLAGSVVYNFESKSCYRGAASVEMVANGDIVADYSDLHSPTGSLGETHGVFINGYMATPVQVRWHKSGRRVSEPTGVCQLTPDGAVEELIDDPDVCDMLD